MNARSMPAGWSVLRELVIRHADKLLLSAAGLAALAALSGANWRTYDRTPAAFQNRASAAEQALATAAWPASEAARFPQADLAGAAKSARSRLREEDYAYMVSMGDPISPGLPRLGLPRLSPVEDLIGSARRVVLLTRPAEAAPVVPGPSTGPAIAPPVRPGGSVESLLPAPATQPPRSGRGLRCVAVRGIVPHRKLAAAMLSAQPRPWSSSLPDVAYSDVEIERQIRWAEGETWSDWRKVDLPAQLDDVRSEWAGSDPEVVFPNVVHPVLTMPLAPLAWGQWTATGGHPRLPPLPVAEVRKSVPQPPAVPQGRMQIGDLPGFPGSVRPEVQEAPPSDILLFRFLDTDVEPGAAYRYRVRLVFENQLHGRPPKQLADPEAALPRTIETPWSEPSPVVELPPDAEFFLTRVVRRNAHPTSAVQMDLHQWDPALGTYARATLAISPGQQVAGTARAEQLDVLKQTLEPRSIDFFNAHLLVDAAGAPAWRTTEPADLLDGRSVADLLQSGTLDETLLADLQGRMLLHTRVRTAAARRVAIDRHAVQMAAIEHLRAQK